MWRLLKDKEDTAQIFRILRAMEGRETKVLWDQFQATDTGRDVLKERRELSSLLSNRDALAAMPSDSFGRAYLDFMKAGDVTAEYFDQVADDAGDTGEGLSEDEKLFRRRCRDMHDLWHVVTGYGRDRIGEISMLAFTYSQFHDRGIRFIVRIGGMDARRRWPDAGIKYTLDEAYRLGREYKWLAGVDWEGLMPRPLWGVRQHLGFQIPRCYRRSVEFLRAAGAEGYDVDPLMGLPPDSPSFETAELRALNVA